MRAGLVEVLAQQRVPADRALDAVPEKASMAASELATHALCHGMPPTKVDVYRRPTAFVVDVTDTGTRPLIVDDDPQPSSFGLQIVESLADAVGWYVDARFKHVWAQIAIPDWRSATG